MNEKLDRQDLIRRARELARLAEKATPGPWKLIWHGNERYPFPLTVHTEDDCYWITRDGTVSSEANARLIAASPGMARLLAEMADALERVYAEEPADELPDRPCFEEIHEDPPWVVSCDEYGPKDCLHKAKGGCWDDCNSGKLSLYYQPKKEENSNGGNRG